MYTYDQNTNVLVAQKWCQWFPSLHWHSPRVRDGDDDDDDGGGGCVRAFITDLRGAKLELELLLILKLRVTTYTTLHGTDL